MKEKIKKYLEKTFLFNFNEEVTEQSDLFELGIIDSLGYIRLIVHLEKEFSVKFTEEEMQSNAFVSVSKIIQEISGKIKP